MKFTFHAQLESVDCGPACLQMILTHLGKVYTLNELKARCHVSRVGITMHDMVGAAKGLGLAASVVKVTPEQIHTIPLPAVLFWRQEHYVVLYNISANAKGGEEVYYLADPAYGKIQLTSELFYREWSQNDTKGIALLLAPLEAFSTRAPDPAFQDKGLKEITSFGARAIQGHKATLSIAFVLFCLAMVTNWLAPLLFQRMIDKGVLPKTMSVVTTVLAAQFVLFLSNIFADYMSSKLLLNVSFKLGMNFLTDFLFKVTRLPIKFFDVRLNTDLIQRVEDQERLQNFLTYRLTAFVIAVLNLLVFSAMVLFYNLYSFGIFLVFSIASICWTTLFLEKRKVLDYSRFSVSAENKNNLYEMILGMAEVKVNNAQHAKLRRWQMNQTKLNDILLRALHLNYYQLFGVNTFNKIKDIAIIGLCAYLVINNRMTLGVMMGISYILGQLNRPIDQIVDFIRSAQDAKISFDRMDEIQQKEDENTGPRSPISHELAFGFDISQISFKYEGSYNSFVLKDVTCCIPKGKITAVVGTSGSGKTTLLKLLLGFYYPQIGDICIDNHKLNEVDIEEWRKRCGVVMQDGYIFSGTIAENIAISDENHDADRLISALDTACISEFVQRLPMGINTKIGKSGVDLSGGQKQRLLIARAVYKNPDFIFFDEATSSLDANNESRIMANLDRFFEGKTVVIVAHRLSTVRNADQIIVLDRGKIVEIGSHHELVESRNAYYELIKNQLELGV